MPWMMRRLLLCTLVASWMVMGAISAMVNSKIDRIIDLTQSVVRVRHSITAIGHNGESTYEVVVKEELVENLAFLSVSNNNALDVDKIKMSYERVKNKNGYAVYAVPLGDEERNSKTLNLDIVFVFTGILNPLPKAIQQTDSHKVLFVGTSYVPSPYETTVQETTVIIPKGAAEDPIILFTAKKPRTQKISKRAGTYGVPELKCGPYTTSIPAWRTGKKLYVHFVSLAKFAKATEVVREIEVSHWGNIAVEEAYELENIGAQLEGGFSRVKYMQSGAAFDGPGRGSSFRSIESILPLGAHDIYFRDRIGNVSTSEVRNKAKGVSFGIKTRYPLYGGWSTSWYFGYNLRPEDKLRWKEGEKGHEGERVYSLTMPFGLPFKEMWAENMTVKVILPEQAKNIKATVPFKVEESRVKRFTYLDSSIGGGRPVVVLQMCNVVNEHNEPFTITYTHVHEFIFLKPVLLSLFIAVVLLTCLAYSIYFRNGKNPVKIKTQ